MNQIRNITEKTEYDALISRMDEQVLECMDYAVEHLENHFVFGVFCEDVLAAVYSFLLIEDEKYLEMTSCYSQSADVYHAMFDYLEERFTGYKIDFAFNTTNQMLKDELMHRDVEWEMESMKMILHQPLVNADDTYGIQLLTDEYTEAFKSIYYDEGYWTGEKVLNAKEKFKVWIAVEDHKLIGYVVVTTFMEINEPWGVFVSEEYRQRGWAKKLMSKVIEDNNGKPLALDVLVDNIHAIHLYESLGFRKVEGKNQLVAHWNVLHH